MRPISYICRVPKQVQRETGRAANSTKRSSVELVQGVQEWVENKFLKVRKLKLMQDLAAGPWTQELVIHRVKSAEEVQLIQDHGIRILHLAEIVGELAAGGMPIQSASGADLVDLVQMAADQPSADPLASAVYRPA
jgi:hypothetical protein